LRNFKDPAAVQALIDASADTDISVRQNAIEGLRIIGTQEAQEFLNPGQPFEKGEQCRCCKASTAKGTYYSFFYGYLIETNFTRSGTTTIKIDSYRLEPSENVYLCHKCVSLQRPRETYRNFKFIATITVIALLIAIPISVFMGNMLFMCPALVLIFAGPLFLYQLSIVQSKEGMPLDAFSDPNLRDTGEHLAINVTRASWSQAGVNRCFTHMEKEKKDG
jgi:hypothetical protein